MCTKDQPVRNKCWRIFIIFHFLMINILFSQIQETSEQWRYEKAEYKDQRAKQLLAGLKEMSREQSKYDVHHYYLKLSIDVENESIGGVVTITARALEAIHSFEVNLHNKMKVDSVLYKHRVVDFQHHDGLVVVNLDTLQKDSLFSVSVYYHGNPEHANPYAFGFDSFQNKPLIWSLSEPFGARCWWPCKDYPSDKADSVDLLITVPVNLIAASNGSLVNIDTLGAQHTFHWHEQYPIATYLVSLAIHPYVNFKDWFISSTGDSLLLDYYVFAEHFQTLSRQYSVTREMLAVFSDLFGEYPFIKEKYGHAEFRRISMEHQTLTSLTTGDPFTIAHELAHQWWGNMITCQDFHHIWLNEGFATYCEALWAEHQGGQDALHQRMNRRRFLGEGTIYVNDPHNDNIFDVELSYIKASWVLHMLRHIVGDAEFFDIFKEYRKRFKYQSVVTRDFKNICEFVSGKELDPFFQQWIYESGYPFYRYIWKTKQIDDNQYRLSILLHQVQDSVVFKMPVDMKLELDQRDTTLVLENTKRTQMFEFQINKKPKELYLDPDHWILRRQQQLTVQNVSLKSFELLNSNGHDVIGLLPGETTFCQLSLTNEGIDLGHTKAVLRTDHPFIDITPDTVSFGNVEAHEQMPPQNRPFEITLHPAARPGPVEFELWLFNSNHIPLFPLTVKFYIGPAKVVLVDDAPGIDHLLFFTDFFTKRYLSYAIWSTEQRGIPPTQETNVPMWIWYTGSDRQTSLTAAEQNALFPIIEQNSNLMVIGKQIGYDLVKDGSSLDSLFFHYVLLADFKTDSAQSPVISGNSYYPYWRHLSMGMDPLDNSKTRASGNVIQPVEPAYACFLYALDRGAAGICYRDRNTNRKQMFLSFDPTEFPSIESEKLNGFERVFDWFQLELDVTEPHNFHTNEIRLSQNIPNPFNPITTIQFSLPQAGQTQINIYNSLGQHVRTFGDYLQAGEHTIKWNGRNDAGRKVASGVYFMYFIFETDKKTFRKSIKMVKLQ